MHTTSRPTLTAALAALALAIVPATAVAGDGDAKPMSSAQAYALTCGHLGVPCDPPHRRHHRARAAHRRHR
jgi:hypothetical protein